MFKIVDSVFNTPQTLTVRADGMSQAHHHVILSGDWVFTDVAAGT